MFLVAHLALDLRLWHESCHRVDDDESMAPSRRGSHLSQTPVQLWRPPRLHSPAGRCRGKGGRTACAHEGGVRLFACGLGQPGSAGYAVAANSRGQTESPSAIACGAPCAVSTGNSMGALA
jgi:hypothetical protein